MRGIWIVLGALQKRDLAVIGNFAETNILGAVLSQSRSGGGRTKSIESQGLGAADNNPLQKERPWLQSGGDPAAQSWAGRLPSVVRYNITTQASTRQLPSYPHHGWHPELPLNTMEITRLTRRPGTAGSPTTGGDIWRTHRGERHDFKHAFLPYRIFSTSIGVMWVIEDEDGSREDNPDCSLTEICLLLALICVVRISLFSKFLNLYVKEE
jgi:hypothetical protein